MGKGQYGGEAALPVWIEYMRSALELYPETSYERPDGVEIVRVESRTGLLATPDTTNPVRVAFIEGSAPTREARPEGYVDSSDLATSDDF